MSEINQDKQVAESRSNPLKDVDAPIRDQIVAKLFRRLKDDGIAAKVDRIWSMANAQRAEWLKRQQAYLATWNNYLPADTSGAFDGASKLHVPATFTACKALHARFLQAIWQDPPFHTKAEQEAWIERVPAVHDVMRFALTKWANHNRGVGKVVDDWVWKWITRGSGIGKLRWDVKYTRFIDVQEVPKPGAPRFEVVDGREVAIPTVRMVEEEVARTVKCFDGPVMDTVELEDIVIVGGSGDPDTADAVLHRQYLTASELWTLADRKVFDADAVAEVVASGNDSLDGGSNNAIKAQRADDAGRSSIDGDEDLDRYEIIEAYLSADVDGSGINSEIIVWVHPRTRALLRATYLYRVSRKGRRPFFKADFHLREGQEFGVGVPELMYPLQRELDAMHQIRVDWGMISVMPFGFYRASSGIDPETIALEPGALIPVDNPATDVYFPNLGNRSVFGMQEEQALEAMIQRLTGINDLSMGMMTSQGATRTASGARLVAQEMSSNLDVHLRRLNWGWEKALTYMLEQLQLRLPKGMAFRITGETGLDFFRKLDNGYEDIAGEFTITCSPNSATSNEAVQQERANAILQTTGNPMDIQLGVVGREQRYEALKNWYMAQGIKDWGRYLIKPEGPTRILTPLEEADRVLIGINEPIDPRGDHEGFIALVEMFQKDEQLGGQLNEAQMAALVSRAREHAAMMQALQAQAAQQANAQQMQMNAAMSSQQAPTAAPQGPQAQPGAGGAPNAAGTA